MPAELAGVDALVNWRGMTVAPDDLPRFEIAHLENGRTEMLRSAWGAEADLSVEKLPVDLAQGWVYCVPLAEPSRQLEFLDHFKSQNRFSSLGCRIAAGTFRCALEAHPKRVREVFDRADVFFCNESEAEILFGSFEAARARPGKVLFVTRGPLGARVLQGDWASDVPGVVAEELDATGAGDTFCGTVLALLAQGEHPVEAARSAVVAAAETVERVGPEALFRSLAAPRPAADARVVVDVDRVDRVAGLLRNLPETEAFSFLGDRLPPSGHPRALDFFFAATLQQFGFWTSRRGRYESPVIASLEGRELKGSDYLWACYRRTLSRTPGVLTPEGQAGFTRADFAVLSRSDEGVVPFPDADARLKLAHRYGSDMVSLGWSPRIIVEEANAGRRPLRRFLGLLDRVAGYKEDPLRKKSTLLGIILQQRPEGFLRCEPGESVPAIVDYHVQRSCLRMGMVQVVDETLRQSLSDRRLIAKGDEEAVRRASYAAVVELQRRSHRSMGAVDWFLFQNRSRCPEMSEPDCGRCAAEPVCARYKELFQPVLRTDFY